MRELQLWQLELKWSVQTSSQSQKLMRVTYVVCTCVHTYVPFQPTLAALASCSLLIATHRGIARWAAHTYVLTHTVDTSDRSTCEYIRMCVCVPAPLNLLALCSLSQCLPRTLPSTPPLSPPTPGQRHEKAMREFIGHRHWHYHKP